MFSHVTLGIGELGRALEFYRAALGPLGLELRFSDARAGHATWAAPGQKRPLLFLTRPFDGAAPHPGNGPMLALLAPDRAAVRACHAAALAAGGQCEGPPGLRPHYHPDYYGAYLRDPDGNKLCFVCHEQEG